MRTRFFNYLKYLSQRLPFGVFECVCLVLSATILYPGAACTSGESPRKKKKPVAASEITGLMPGYNLKQPTRVATLPGSLREASDVTAVSQTEIAMVQDEKGIIYLYDFDKFKVTEKLKFGPKGDYEGLALVDDAMYVLKSNGTLYKTTRWRQEARAFQTPLNLPTADNEGLCFDPVSRKLLISPKSRWKKKKGGGKHKRPIFAFDPKSGKVSEDPMFVLRIDDMVTFARTHHLTLPGKVSKKGKFKEKLEFRPAAIAVHPNTGHIYVVSATDRVMLSFNRQGQISGLSVLDKELFLQPEGLAFLPDGTMIVVNESPKKKPGLLLFKWEK